MGNDGGSIPTRRELVREAARNPSTAQVKEAQREQQEHSWTTCPISHNQLMRPIVSDSVGNLYNKDAILRFLLPGDEADGISSKADCEEILCGRVKGLRDVVELKFEVDTEREAHPANGKQDKREGWICPVTAKQLGPNVKSVYLVPCGHVFSEEAIRQLKGDKCLQCDEPYTPDNVIPILPTKEADKQQLIERGHKLAEQGLTHSLKKAPGSKKRKKNAANGDAADAGKEPKPMEISTSATASRSNTSTPIPGGSSGIKNAATALLTARVLEEENEKKKRRKMLGTSDNISSLFTKETKDGHAKNTDFMTRGYSLPAAARK
ncbi:Rtf2 RING-finger-domain-containing protein [Aspergillus welwitschiae]|uniref:Rtf2 RING-finger-domain-containing protein n=1 Tax=Aspergillus welwitschiae TaxID=1341132 RepID=A0A3F3PNH2_9EURO|nr:Rtf2 RING-finger-domain-containing protein [Aspergillus welwitschiae]RDH28459.1 Rtf2 RING-finger-domain-containing protein [Aspergillus welwitschiae]